MFLLPSGLMLRLGETEGLNNVPLVERFWDRPQEGHSAMRGSVEDASQEFLSLRHLRIIDDFLGCPVQQSFRVLGTPRGLLPDARNRFRGLP